MILSCFAFDVLPFLTSCISLLILLRTCAVLDWHQMTPDSRILTRIVAQHGAKELQNIKLAYDGRSNLYTSRRLAQEEFNL